MTTAYVVSSYTPTLDALLVGNSVSNMVTDPRIVVVAQPEVDNLPDIPSTVCEFNAISEVVLSSYILNVDGTTSSPPKWTAEVTVEDVMARLKEANIIHFACHGTQDTRWPLESALYLHGGPLTISKMQSARRPQLASLAFLSACETAMGDPSLADEVMHLSAAMLSVGFQGVVGTMWYVSRLSF